MAFRSTITLSDKDQALLDRLKQEMGISSSSQAIATAVQIAEYIKSHSNTKGEITLKNNETNKEETIKFVGF